MRKQAERWGAELYQEDVEFVDVKNSPFTVQSSERKVILSSGSMLSFIRSGSIYITFQWRRSFMLPQNSSIY